MGLIICPPYQSIIKTIENNKCIDHDRNTIEIALNDRNYFNKFLDLFN